MTPAEIAPLWIAAFNRHDVGALVALYAEDAVHYSPKLRVAQPKTEGKIAGQAALTAWWREAFDRLPSLRYELKTVTADAARVFIIYERHAANETPMTVAELFEVRDGRIVASRVFHG